MGGLGNQLFQIFNLISYCLTHKLAFHFEPQKQEKEERPFYWDNFLKSLKPFIKIKQINQLYREPHFHYKEIPSYSVIKKPFKIVGYFQSYKYFQHQEKNIFKLIKLEKQKETIKTKYMDIYNFEDTISLHFRIGDYKHLQEHHPIVSIDYYKKAIQYIINKTNNKDWTILYFYEEQDKEEVHNNVSTLKKTFPNLTFIPINTNIPDYEQILLISLCKHNIIANSSFSWWGAYFNTNQNKIVCHPNQDKWFGPGQGQKNMNDLIPHTWVKIYDNTSILIIDSSCHHKNKEGFEKMIKELNWYYNYGTERDIESYDIIYSPSQVINTSKYPNKKFIFGPHFSVFPDQKLHYINNKYNNSIYIQPSDWANQSWVNMKADQFIPIKTFSFPVNTEKFRQVHNDREKVYIYFKRRKPEELNYVKCFLDNKKIEYKIFDYVQKYEEHDYLQYLQNSKYGIILDAHESQGFATEEALSCNVPLLVWNTKHMSQEYGSKYNDIPCSSIPYWDERCGEFFYEKEDFEKTFDIFIHKLETYQPRQYILDNLTAEKCGNNFKKIFKL